MRALPSLLSALCLLCLPVAAHAACESVVRATADQVQRGTTLSSTNLGDLRSACGSTGAAQVVDELVARGARDEAGQLGRSLGPSFVRLDAAVVRADECISAQLRYGLDDLSAAASEPMREAEDEREVSGSSAGGGLVGRSRDLGTRGQGYGGEGRDSADAWHEPGPPAAPPGKSSRAPRAQTEDRKYKSADRAATGIGAYTPAPDDDRVAEATRIPAGSQVAWSSLSFRVWFDYDSSALRREALATLRTLAAQIRDMDDVVVLEVIGHTDSSGSWWYNEDLSVRRAASVEAALLMAGVDPAQMTTRGLGESAPAYSNASEWGRARNRRVEFRFYRRVAQQVTR